MERVVHMVADQAKVVFVRRQRRLVWWKGKAKPVVWIHFPFLSQICLFCVWVNQSLYCSYPLWYNQYTKLYANQRRKEDSTIKDWGKRNKWSRLLSKDWRICICRSRSSSALYIGEFSLSLSLKSGNWYF